VARHVIAPAGITTTGWPRVRDTCARLGWGFDGWQDGAGKLILSKRADGSYAADTIVISIPRQVGKTYLIACIIFALCLTHKPHGHLDGAPQDTALRRSAVRRHGAAARRWPHIAQVLRGKGDEKILFNNGSSILFGARESGFGRGFTGVDVMVCDEGQILSESAGGHGRDAERGAKNPLFFVMGTPPRPKDPASSSLLLRQEALDGESDGTLYIETSADRGADPMDRKQWRKANPSFPHRTTERAMLRLRKKLKNDDSWNREALGIWDEIVKQFSPINGAMWADGADVGPRWHQADRPGRRHVPRALISVGACWVEANRRTSRKSGPAPRVAAVEWVVARAGRTMPVVIDASRRPRR
jgi:hypothetical protein